ncbi:MAG: hypothetical protein ACRC1K_04705 [Planctomycetia bacterium]
MDWLSFALGALVAGVVVGGVRICASSSRSDSQFPFAVLHSNERAIERLGAVLQSRWQDLGAPEVRSAALNEVLGHLGRATGERQRILAIFTAELLEDDGDADGIDPALSRVLVFARAETPNIETEGATSSVDS